MRGLRRCGARPVSTQPEFRSGKDRFLKRAHFRKTAYERAGADDITVIESEALSEVELNELESVLERHKTVYEISQAFGVFTSLCVPRLLVTIRNLQRELELVTRQRHELRASDPDDAHHRLGKVNG
jgi:hypothetical protein